MCGGRPASLAPVFPAYGGCLSLKAVQGVRYVVSARSDGSVGHHGWRAGDGTQQDRVETATSRAAAGPLNTPRAQAPTSSFPPLWRPIRRLVNSASWSTWTPRPLPNGYALRNDRQTASSAMVRRMTRRRGRLARFVAYPLLPEGPGTAWDRHLRPALVSQSLVPDMAIGAPPSRATGTRPWCRQPSCPHIAATSSHAADSEGLLHSRPAHLRSADASTRGRRLAVVGTVRLGKYGDSA